MAAGLLAHQELGTNNLDIQVYTVPSGKKASFTARIVNRSGVEIKVRLAISDTNTLNNTFYILYDQTIFPGDTYTEPGLVLDQGQFLFARTNHANVNVVAWGFEE